MRMRKSCLIIIASILFFDAELARSEEIDDRVLVKCIEEHATKVKFQHPSLERIVDNVKEYFQSDETEYHIAIIGPTGVGKSTILNRLIGKKNTDPGASPVCHGQECTGKSAGMWNEKGYKSTFNPRVRYYDLPGGGTQTYKMDEYIQKFELVGEVSAKGFKKHKYDAVLLVNAGGRVPELNIKLHKELKSAGVPIYVIANKINEVIDNGAEDGISAEELKQQVRTEIKKEYKLNDVQEVFLLGRRNVDDMNFPRLTQHLYGSLCVVAAQQMYAQIEQIGLACSVLCKAPKPTWSTKALMAGAAALTGAILAGPMVAPVIAPYYAGVGVKIAADGAISFVNLYGAAAFNSGMAAIGSYLGGGMAAGAVAVATGTAVTSAVVTLAATSANKIMCGC